MARKSRVCDVASLQQTELQEIYKTALYLRLSDEDITDEEQNSIGNQRKICMDYIADKSNMVVVGTYIDNGFSGTNFSRNGFRKMMLDVKSGKVNCIIVKDLSRFGRNYIETSEFLEREFPKQGIRFIAVNNHYDTLNGGNAKDGIALPFMNIVNDFYAKDTSKKIRSSIQTMMAKGEFLPSSSSIPYGYIRHPEENTFLVDEEVAKVVVRIFEMRRNGSSYNHIANVLNTEGVLSPGKLRYIRGLSKDKRFEKAQWIRKTIRNIVSDPVYLGHRVHGKVKKDRIGQNKTAREKENWIYIYHVHPAIITQEMFDEVQKVNEQELLKRKNYVRHDDPDEDYREVLKGKLFCGDCNHKMIALKRNQRITSQKKPVIVYQCNQYVNSNRNECHNHYINESEIIEELKNVLNMQVKICLDMEKLIQQIKVRKSKQRNKKRYQDNLTNIAHRKQKNVLLKERLLKDYMDGLIDKEEYLFAKQKYEKAYDELLQEEENYQKQEDSVNQILFSTSKWIEALKQFQAFQIINKEILDGLVNKIYIYPNKSIEIVLNYKDAYQELISLLQEMEEVERYAI